MGVVIAWGPQGPGLQSTSGPWSRALTKRKADAFPRAFTNASGETVEVTAPPIRIVSGTMFSDAVLLEVCSPERVRALNALSRDVLP